jgi:hypothetical protein
MNKTPVALAVSLALYLLASHSAQAARYYRCEYDSALNTACWSASPDTFVPTTLPISTDFTYYGFSAGTYQTATLQAFGSAYSYDMSLGRGGAAGFVQYGGSNEIAYILHLGLYSGSLGSYTLHDGTLTTPLEHIGVNGTGEFIQNGGAHTVSDRLYIGLTGGTGSYLLSGGELAASTEYIGYGYDSAGFTQTGGSHSVSNALVMAQENTGRSTYTLSGSGSLSAATEIIGVRGVAEFNQTGGTNTVAGELTLAQTRGTGTYNLSGGTLTVNTIRAGAGDGIFNFDGGELNVIGSTIQSKVFRIGNALYKNNSLTLASGKSLSTNELVIGNAGTGTYAQLSGAHTVSSMLTLAANSGSSGTYNMNGGTATHNTIAFGAGTGTFNLNGGDLTVRSVTNGAGQGTFNHNGGTLTLQTGMNVDTLNLGHEAGADVSFTLDWGKTLTVATETIGASGAASVTQLGTATHTVSKTLTLGANSGGSAIYNLDGGTLSVAMIQNGAGNSTLNINGGTLSTLSGAGTIDVDTLVLGATGAGYYTHKGGALIAGNETIGSATTGVFTQNAGNHTVAGTLTLAADAGSTGTYYLEGGRLNVATIATGAGTSTMYVNSGSLTVGSIVNGSGTSTLNVNSYNLSLAGTSIDVDTFNLGTWSNAQAGFTLAAGQALNATNETIGLGGYNTLTQTGGMHQVANALTINPGSQLKLSGGTLMAGSMSNGGRMELSGGTVIGNLSSRGRVYISNSVEHTGDLTQTAGILNVDGSLNTGLVTLQGGVLTGSGHITGTVHNSAGTIAAGNSPGRLTITGDYTQAAAATFEAQLGGLLAGTQYDVLDVSGNAFLDGTLSVSLLDLGSGLFAPQTGDYFDILSAEQLHGAFSILSLAALADPNQFWRVDYLTDAYGSTDVVRLSVLAVPEPETWAMMLGGLGLLGLRARRRNTVARKGA